MTTDDFTTAAQDEAVKRWPHLPYRPETHVLAVGKRIGFDLGASWARAHLAEQEPTDAEVEALCRAVDEQAGFWLGPITASMVLQESRRAAREARQ